MNSASGPVLAVDATRMAPERTGIENYLHHVLPGIARGWRSPAEPGVRPGSITVLALDRAVVDHVSPTPEIVIGKARGWTQLALVPTLRRAGASVYFSPIPILPMFRAMPCPAVVTVHDFHDFRARWWYYRRLLERTFSVAAAIVCVSQATLQQLQDEFPAAAPKAVVVREGADPEIFHPNGQLNSPVLRRMGIEVPPLLAVGTIQPRKNYANLLAAYARVPADVAPPLVIVGRQGWDYEEVMSLPASLGIADRVVFAGHLAEADVGELMRASLLLCALSTGEGFGLPLLEAMYSGLPILASDIPPFREVAGNAARFVNPLAVEDIAAGLQSLLNDPQSRSEMSRVGLGRRDLFRWDTAAAAIVEVLRRSLTSV